MIIDLLELFFTFFVIGLFTIGGGYAMIPMITQMVVSKGWLTIDQLWNFIAIAESTPGPFAVNTATLVGFSQIPEAPILGALVTTTGVVLPSFIIIIIIAKFLTKFLDIKAVRWILNGIKATVVGLIIAVFINMLVSNIFVGEVSFNNIDIYAVIIFVSIFILSRTFKKKIGPIPIIIISGLLGLLFYWII